MTKIYKKAINPYKAKLCFSANHSSVQTYSSDDKKSAYQRESAGEKKHHHRRSPNPNQFFLMMTMTKTMTMIYKTKKAINHDAAQIIVTSKRIATTTKICISRGRQRKSAGEKNIVFVVILILILINFFDYDDD